MSDRKNDSSKNRYSRREFLRKGALSTLAAGPIIFGGRASAASRRKIYGIEGEAENVIFMVSDGMSTGTLGLADLVKQRQFGKTTNWVDLYNSERTFHRGLMDMASLNSPVTDSSAAASSWGSGQRINNGALNVGPGGEQYRTILQIFKEAGKKTGLVTTTRITHATPSGFGINMPDRNSEDAIALQYLEREYDLLLGGGARHFGKADREDGKDLFSGFKVKNYEVVRNRRELMNVRNDGRLFGIFSDSHLPFTVDHKTVEEYREIVPTLAEMTGKALENLQGKNGFILQVEGGRVDHAAHDNDPAGLVYDQIAFDEAIKVALDFTEGRDDTLLIITTDHGNANPGLNGAGPGYTDAGPMLDRLQEFRRSNNWILSGLDENSSVSQIRERIDYATGIAVEHEEAEMLRKSLGNNLVTPYKVKQYPDAVLASILANYISIYFISGAHTADYVELAVLGPGIDKLDNFTRNTELFDLMVEATGVTEYTQSRR